MPIRSLESLYAIYPTDTPDGAVAREVLVQSAWLYDALEFDPLSGEALPQALSHFLRRVRTSDAPDAAVHDRLWRIVAYSADAFRRIVRALNEQPRTDHARMHVSKVREMDASSFVKLANRTGRTIREKLGNDPFVTAIRHFQSVDILENRLLKAYAMRMEELLELRVQAFDEPENDFLIDIRNWLASDEARSISRWTNLPPNNALLSHRDYRRIWKAWRWLQTLDDDVKHDAERVAEHRRVRSFWNRVAEFYADGGVLADLPMKFDYDAFAIEALVPGGVLYARGAAGNVIEIGGEKQIPKLTGLVVGVGRSAGFSSASSPVCIDFSALKPAWTDGHTVNHLDELFVWQCWSVDGNGAVPISLFDAVCVWTASSASTVTIRDLIQPGRVGDDLCERAASEFLAILRERFQSKVLIWLVPDCVNEFDLSVLRRHINNAFECAQPLPRSIATLLTRADRKKIKDGYAVTVLDSLGGRVYATKLVARKCSDPDYGRRVPEMQGCYWERQPTVVLEDRDWPLMERLAGVHVLDEELRWSRPERGAGSFNLKELKKRLLDSDERFKGTEVIVAEPEPVVGGLMLYEWQQKAGDIPLWRDHLPDLDLSASSGTEMVRVHLVSNKTIVPRTGTTVEIPVEATFTLPAGRDKYVFPLHQGTGSARLRYQARLSARNVFPLKEDLPCSLLMRYTYGADNPYELRFVPKTVRSDLSSSFLVEWVPMTLETDEGNIPIPGFPSPVSLEEMSSYGSRHIDMLERLRRGLDRLLQYSSFLASERTTRRYERLTHPLAWRECGGENGGRYAFLGYGASCLSIHSEDFETFDKNATEISFDIEKDRKGRFRARNVTLGETIPSKFTWARPLLRTPMSIAFGVMRDEEEMNALGSLRTLLERALDAAGRFYEMDEVYAETRNELLWVMAYYDPTRLPQMAQELLDRMSTGTASIEQISLHWKTIALAIGDCSETWQQTLWRKILSKSGVDKQWSIVVYKILSVTLWRSPGLVHVFTKEELEKIFPDLGTVIERDCRSLEFAVEEVRKATHDRQEQKKKKALFLASVLCKHLELLLALLRTRGSENPAIRRMTRPGSPGALRFVSIIGDRVMPLFQKHRGLRLDSRIRLDVVKPEMYRNSPDLLYALKLYLTGDDGANAIIVSGISEED